MPAVLVHGVPMSRANSRPIGLTFNYLRLRHLGSYPRSRNANGNAWSLAMRPSICPETKP